MNESKKKILYIDPLLQMGHVNFNNIYIENLKKEGYILDFVLVDDYELCLDKSGLVYSIPKILFRNNWGKLGNRIAYFIALMLIKWSVEFKKYDYVLFSSFEEVSFFFSGIKNCYLINHINVSSSYKSKFKFFFIKKVLRKNTLIVLDTETKRFLDSKGNYKVIFQPHGLPRRKSIDSNSIDPKYDYIINKVKKFKRILFSPSDSSSDKSFLNDLVQNNVFLTYLEENSILFIYKNNNCIRHSNVIEIAGFLDQNMYDFLFLNCSVILIAYPDSFRYRVSGVLLESFANNKPCVISNIPALSAYRDFFNYNPLYETVKDLIDVLEEIDKHTFDYYKKMDVLEPNFRNEFI